MEIAISVIMPVYNMEAYVAAAIDSILSQTFADFEFIIINDGSTDNSRDIVESYLFEPRLNVVNFSRNCGNYPARNAGMRQARGKYICVMDADDIAHPDRLRVEYEYMENHPAVLAAGSHYSMMGTGCKPIKPQDYHSIRKVLLSHNCFLHPSLIIRADALKSVGGYDENLIYSADYDLMCRLALEGPVVNLPESLMSYRWHSQQISTAHRVEQLQYAQKARCRYQIRLINQLVENTDFQPVTLNEVVYSPMGQAIFCFVYSRVNGCEEYEEKGEQLLGKAYQNIYDSDVISIEEKLIAIRHGIIYLLSNGLAQGDADEILADIDKVIPELF